MSTTELTSERLERYLGREIYRVGGYTDPFQAEVISHLLEAQRRFNVVGGMVEIGVHHGRSFFVMALHRNSGEKCLAIDLFEDDDMYVSGPERAGRMDAFRANQQRLEIRLGDDEVHKGSSLDLKPADILSVTGPVRFFSIDGGHRYHHVENDLALAQQTAGDEAVIVIDDFAIPVWPEVTFATYDWLRAGGSDWAPFAVVEGKLFVCRRNHADRYRSALRSPDLIDTIRAEADYFDDKVLVLARSLPERAKDALLRRVLRSNSDAPRFS